ncbi:MAG: dephospho-CoA kinase [Lachnospiraceae bacterium]|nr:dephospho-CoA kinase [Lachnospiraceae bacterium]
MKVIGITGGVGSGKSLVVNTLKEMLDAKVLIADDIGKELSSPGGALEDRIIAEFGTIDRGELANIIFKDREKKKCLEDIIHPAVIGYITDVIEENKEREGFILLESAILFESKTDALCDEIWYIFVNKEKRIERLMKDRGYTREKCEAIIEAQKPDEYYKEKCDQTIDNSYDKIHLQEELKKVVSLINSKNL